MLSQELQPLYTCIWQTFIQQIHEEQDTDF